MKRIFSIFILLVHLTLSCLAANNSFWKPIGEDFDRLTLLADGWSRGERRDINPRDILSRMQSVAALHPGDDVMQARAIYWRVCFGPGLEPAVADSLLDEALHLVGDRHPYDRARFMMQQAVILSKQADYADAYRLYMSAAAEFEAVGDERLLGYTHYNISYIFLLLGEYAEAEANAVAADSLFARVHGDGLRLDAQMLLASIYERAGDSGKAYDILHSQNNTFRTMGYDYTLDTETNVVGSYLMVQFVYRFNTMGAGKKSDRSPSGDWRRRPMRGVMRAMPMRIPT